MNWKEIGLTVSVKWYSKKKKYNEIKPACQIRGLLGYALLIAFHRIKPGRFSKIVIGYQLLAFAVVAICLIFKPVYTNNK
jgi:hypothetical protein